MTDPLTAPLRRPLEWCLALRIVIVDADGFVPEDLPKLMNQDEFMRRVQTCTIDSNPAPTDDKVMAHWPHSRACGISKHQHGYDCHSNCPSCAGRDLTGVKQPERTETIKVNLDELALTGDNPPCPSAINIKGEHYPCDWPTDTDGRHDGWGHANKAAEAIWRDDRQHTHVTNITRSS